MRCRIDHCRYELVKDLLLSADSLVQSVEKDGMATIVTLQNGCFRDDLMKFMSQDPLYRFCEYSRIHVI